VAGQVLVEPAWEMNGNWNYAWQGVANGNASGPQLYVNAWRRMVDRFRAAGATNVRWVWNPNTGNPLAAPGAGSSHWNWYANYFPGDSYVDFVGAHGYNGPNVFNTPSHTFTDLFSGIDADYMLKDLKQRYPGKPIILGEIGAEETGDKGAWIRDAYTNMLKDPQVVGAVWFNMNKEADWRVSSSQSAANAYRAMMTLSAVKPSYDDSVLRGAPVMVANQ
jgi:mannan endo-1,4-beta-mannosidase